MLPFISSGQHAAILLYIVLKSLLFLTGQTLEYASINFPNIATGFAGRIASGVAGIVYFKNIPRASAGTAADGVVLRGTTSYCTVEAMREAVFRPTIVIAKIGDISVVSVYSTPTVIVALVGVYGCRSGI